MVAPNLEHVVVYYEDWVGGESVTVINTVPPDMATNLTASNVSPTAALLSWTASPTPGVIGYDIKNGSTYIGTTASTTYKVTGLTPGTAYTFTVEAKNQEGLSAAGASVAVTTPKGTHALAMNGTTDFIQTPVLTFDTVIMNFSAEPKAGAYGAYIDASRGIAQSAFGRDSSGRDFLQNAWKSLAIDGVDKTSLAGTAAIVPTNLRVTATTVLKAAGKANITIFANQLGQIAMKGILYNATFLLGGNVVAYYDFTQPFVGTAVPDKSGNNNTATLRGGTWVIV